MRSRLCGGLAAALSTALLATGIGAAGTASAGPTPVAAVPRTLAAAPQPAPTDSAPAARRAMDRAVSGARPRIRAGAARPAAVNLAPTGSFLTALAPVRVLDTRTSVGGAPGMVQAGQTILLDLSAQVPAAATAVVLNVTGTDVTQSTYVTVWPDGTTDRPTASNLNLVAGQTRANGVTVALGPDHKVDLYNFHGTLNLIADLAGYYATGAGAGYTSMSPTRVLDTRGTAPVGTGQTIVLDLSSLVPAAATAATFNLTGLAATAGTYVTVWPDGTTDRPTASSLNLVPGDITPNLVTVALGPDRKVDLYNFHGSVQLVADLAGYYATGTGDAFYQLVPDRVLDTRFSAPLGNDQQASMNLSAWMPAVPLNTSAAVFNLTGTDPTASTYVTAWPTGASLPTASNLNLAPGQTASNLAIVQTSADSLFLYNFRGTVDLVMDLAGYFAPSYGACSTRCVYAWGDNNYGQLGNGTTGGFSGTPTPMINMTDTAALAAGALDGYALDNSTAIRSWGYNGDGELGNGLPYGLSPTVGGVHNGAITTAGSLVAGAYSAYALQNGTAYAWGYNGDGELGSGTQSQASPVQVPVSGTVSQLAAGFETGYALTTDGSVWAWGVNGGSLGDGSYGTGCDTTPVGAGCRSTPIRVPNLTGVVSIWAGWNDTFAIKADGTVWGWGWNAESELGIDAGGGAACYRDPLAANCAVLAPVQIPGLTGVTKIVPGLSTTYAIKADGTVLAMGWNGQGELGIGVSGGAGCPTDPTGPNCYSATPVAVSGLTGVRDLAAGQLFALALNADGTVSTWGDDTYGQLGLPAAVATPTRVARVSGITAIGAGGLHAFASADTP